MANQYDTIQGTGSSATANIVDYDTVATFPDVAFLLTEEQKMSTLIRTVSGDTITIGDTVLLGDNGTVLPCGDLPDTISDPISASATTGIPAYGFSVYDPVTEKTILIWEQDSSFKAVTATISGGTIITGVVNSFAAVSSGQHVTAIYDPDNDKIVVAYTSYIGGYYHYIIGCDIIPHATDPTQDSLSFGSPILLVDSNSAYSRCSLAYDPTRNIILASLTTNVSSDTYVIVYDGTIFTVGGNYTFHAATNDEVAISVYEPVNDRLAVMYKASTGIYGVIGTITTGAPVSASSISFGTPVLLTNNYPTHPATIELMALPSGDVVSWHYDNQVDSNVTVGVINDTTISWGTIYDITPDTGNGYGKLSYDIESDSVLVVTGKSALNAGQYITNCSIDGTTVTVIENSEVSYAYSYVPSLSYDPSSGYHIIAHNGTSYQLYYRAYKVNSSNLTANNILGIAQNTANVGEECIVGRYGFIDENQSGLTPGSSYYIDSSGTLTTVSTNNVYIGLALTSSKLLIKA